MLLGPELSSLCLERRDWGVKIERRSRSPFNIQLYFDLGDCGALFEALDTKNVRNAVAAVMVSAMFAAINCQYVPQTESIDGTVRPVWIPEIRVMVHTIVRIVRHRQSDRAIFWVRLILIVQIRRQGIYRT